MTSLELVMKYCNLCHKYAQKAEETDNPEYLRLRDNAMTQARKAFEEHESASGFSGIARVVGRHFGLGYTTGEVIEACNKCDYKKPRIVQLLTKKHSSECFG